jgi:hypothetical protein
MKVLLMVLLLGGLRTAIFVTEMPKARSRPEHGVVLDWLMAMLWPAMPEQARQPVRQRRDNRGLR